MKDRPICEPCGEYKDECRCFEMIPLAPPSGSEVPTVAGYYWFSGLRHCKGEWQLVRVFRPLWVDPNQQDLYWQYLDWSGGDDAERYAVANFPGQWSGPILPPNTNYPSKGSV